jgi:hypothetical protein
MALVIWSVPSNNGPWMIGTETTVPLIAIAMNSPVWPADQRPHAGDGD